MSDKPLEMVHWYDAYSKDQWHTKIAKKPVIVTTVGFVLYEDDLLLNIAQSLSNDEGHFAQCIIPKGCVIDRRRLA